MWNDPIVEEVHAIREQLLAQFGGDLHKFCEYARTQTLKSIAPRDQTLPAASQVDAPKPTGRPG
jgi:hypothetical protein